MATAGIQANWLAGWGTATLTPIPGDPLHTSRASIKPAVAAHTTDFATEADTIEPVKSGDWPDE